MSTLAAPAVGPKRYVQKFRCPGCRHHRRTSTRHPSGNCAQCILRGHRYWSKRWDLAEIREVACLIWPEDFLLTPEEAVRVRAAA